MPELTRRPDPYHANSWLIYFGTVHVGTIARAEGMPNVMMQWKWSCGFYPGSSPGELRGGTAESFDRARAAFKAAWQDARCTKADFLTCRDQQAWTVEKYLRLDREPMPRDWRPPHE